MSKIKRLIQSYNKYISIPWRNDAAAAQRVIFCVYNENEERRLRAKTDEFEIVTRQAGHKWAEFDLTDTLQPGWDHKDTHKNTINNHIYYQHCYPNILHLSQKNSKNFSTNIVLIKILSLL